MGKIILEKLQMAQRAAFHVILIYDTKVPTQRRSGTYLFRYLKVCGGLFSVIHFIFFIFLFINYDIESTKNKVPHALKSTRYSLSIMFT